MRTTLFAVSLLFFLICSPCFAQQLSSEELDAILRIETWRVPMPTTDRYGWHIGIVDYNPPADSEPLLPQAKPVELNLQQKALVALRRVGKNTYETTVKTTLEAYQGELEIDVCTEKEKSENRCDNTYSIKWYVKPKAFRSGPGFLLADIMKEGRVRKQIILELTRQQPRRKAGGGTPAP